MARRTFEEWYKDFLKYNQNGSVTARFITPEGNKLGQWVRSVRAGCIKLTCEQKQMLNDVNFIWIMQKPPRKFEEWYEDFLKYNQNGSVPVKFITPEGNKLGQWVRSVRVGDIKLTCEQKQMLNDVNFIWAMRKKSRKFEEWYEDFLKYNQNGSVPKKFITPEGNKLGQWVQNIRLGRARLTNEQKEKLSQAGFRWETKSRKFEEWYEDFLKYNQNGSVPCNFTTPEGNKLGNWVHHVRLGDFKLTDEQREKLNQAGFRWEKIIKSRKFKEWYEDFLKYNQNGSVPVKFITPEGNKLGLWVRSVRAGDIKLTCEQKQMLNDVNFIWVMQKNSRKFEEWYEDFLKYNQNGSVPVKFITPEGKKLGIWVNNVRSGDIRLTDDQKQLLKDANFVWALRKGKKHQDVQS